MLSSAILAHHSYPLGPRSLLLFFHLPPKWAFVFAGTWGRMVWRAEIPQVNVWVESVYTTISCSGPRSFKRWMFTRLWAFRWLWNPPASGAVIDDTSMLWGLAALSGKLPVFGQELALFTHGEIIKTSGARRFSFKAEWCPSVFDIESTKAFRLLINYCFHRGNYNKWFVSCCLTKNTTGTVN